MRKLNVTIIHPDGRRRQAAALSDDVAIDRLAAKLAEMMGLPLAGPGGQPLAYLLHRHASGMELAAEQTLAQAGVEDGDVLGIRPVRPAGTARGEASHRPSQVNVLITDIGGSKEQQASLPDHVPVRRIIAKLVRMMGLPTYHPDGSLWVYHFHHRASGRQLGDEETLAEAGICDGNVLRLAPDVTAGGGPDPNALVAVHPWISRVPVDGRGTYQDLDDSGADDVDCTVFGPPDARAADSALVQVYVHRPDLSSQALEMAQEFDDLASRRGVTSLGTKISRGARLALELVMRDLIVHEPVRQVTWRGDLECVNYEVDVPPDARSGTHVGTVLISQDAVPIGEIRFKLSVAVTPGQRDQGPWGPWGPWESGHPRDPIGQARRYQTAFISYASRDREEVLRCVRLLPAAGIKFFQDVLELEPGDRWQDQLWSHIDESDVMFLFWSTAAKESEWVTREWRYALEHKGEDYVRPIIIEGPPPVPPPPELEHLHFDDKVGYFLKAVGP